MKMKYSLSVITAVILFFDAVRAITKSNSTIWAFNGTYLHGGDYRLL